MRCILDTHALLWWLFDDPKLSVTARETIAEPDNDILVSAASTWEIATKHRIGKLPEAGSVVQERPPIFEERVLQNSRSLSSMRFWPGV